MKKITIILLIFFFGINISYSQIQPGKTLVGISLSGDFTTQKFKSSSEANYKSYSFELSPSYGNFLSDNFLIGISVNYYFSYYEVHTLDNSQSDRTDLHRSNLINLAPFARYYINLGSKFYLFMQGTIYAGYNYMVVYSNGIKQASQGTNDFDFGISLNPGINYFISDKFLL